ncbi:MAG: M48 family metallopeptidase [Elusimicrobiota bacterium]|jgi:heat shock protein HtpX|nr:M48 family metallopeptidase [Elusimicrobiota bacterium]
MLTLYDHIGANKRKTAIIILLFPLVLSLMMYMTVLAVAYFMHDAAAQYTPVQAANAMAAGIFPFVIAAALIWTAISWFAGDSMMLAVAGAREIQRADNPEIYSLVENTARAAGLPVPRVFIMRDDSLNAFATGRNPRHCAVALTSGIIKKLNRSELEGVIAHEMAHIGNRDVSTMMLVIMGIGAITTIGELMVRVGGRMRGRKNPGPFIAMLGVVLMLYGVFLAPLIMYALSRRREYQADATGVLITRNPEALASALAKISGDSRVEALDSMPLMSSACISNAARGGGGAEEGAGFMGFIASLYSTHPPIRERIEILNRLDGQR